MSPTTSRGAGGVPATDEAPETPVREHRLTAPARVAGGTVSQARCLIALFLFVGALQVMKTGAGQFEALHHGGFLVKMLDIVYGNLLAAIEGRPAAVLFLGGLGILLVAFKLIDDVVPEIGREEIERSRLSWMTSKYPMFGLGSLVALVAMSVSVALTVLVPLVAKGYVNREDILLYIMGANITTLGDTLLAAFLLDSPAVVQIVLAGIIGTTIVSFVLLTFFYPQLKRGIWRFQRQMVKSKTRLLAFTAGLFVVPIATIRIAGVVG
jgi:hypothetical protein